MSRLPHVPQILQGPLAARPAAQRTPEWVWYFAWDDDGGAFYRPTPEGWVKATPSVGSAPWQDASLGSGWTPISGAPLQFRLSRGIVELRGGVSRSAGALPSEVTTLPVGYRPPNELRFPVVLSQGLSYVSIAPNGVIRVHDAVPPGGSVNNGVYLDSVRFAPAE
jgi:hypothetical protein